MSEHEDIAGQPLAVGDRVATLMPGYRELALATVVYLTPKGLKVRLDEPRGLRAMRGLPRQLSCGQVCRLPADYQVVTNG